MTFSGKNKSKDGFALIIVLVVITFLGVMAGGFAYSMKVEMKLAQQSSLDSDFEWLGRSGVEMARMLLSSQMKGPGNQAAGGVDSLKQRWAGGPGDGTDTNEASQIPLDNVQLVEDGGTFSIKIVDADRKFNINRVNGNMQAVLQTAMVTMGVDAGTSPTVVDSILDWIDRDTDEHVGGAESRYYSKLDPPYNAKDGPIDDMTELLLVKGIDTDPAILWGSSSTNVQHWSSSYGVKSRLSLNDEEQPPAYPFGLIDLFTPVSGGRVNINTADERVLRLIPGLDDPNLVEQIMTHRRGPDGQDGTGDDAPFQNTGELATFNLPPQLITEIQRYISVSSAVFEVTVNCDIGGIHREYFALIYRMGTQCQVLWMYWKGGGGQTVGPALSADNSQ